MSTMSAKELKAKQKQLEKLQMQLRTKESQLDKRERKISDREKQVQQLESRLESERKEIARDKKMIAQAKKKGAAAAQPKRQARSELGAGSSRKIAQLEAELKKAKADASAKGREAKKHYQTILDLEQRIKVLERQVQNLKKKGKGKGNNKALKNARKEIRQLKKKLKQLLRELAKKRRWFQRVIKQFKTDRASWARKQKQALADKRVMVRYIFLDDVKKISVYRRGKDNNKFMKRARVSLDTDDKASVVVKDLQIVYVNDDGDDDDDADGAATPGGRKKKPRKKSKKTDAEVAAEEDSLEDYLAEMFPRDYAAATTADHGDDPVDFDEDLEAMIAVSSEEDSEEEAAAKKKKRRRGKKKPGAGGADGGDEDEKGDGDDDDSDDDDDDELGLGGTDDAAELKGQIEELGKDAAAKNDELNKIRWLILRAGQPGGAEGVANDTVPIPSVAQALKGDVPAALAAGMTSDVEADGDGEGKSEDSPDGVAGGSGPMSLSFWSIGIGPFEKDEKAADADDEAGDADGDGDGADGAAAEDGSAESGGAGAGGKSGAGGLTPMAALESCVASKAALDQAFEDMKAKQAKRMASLDSWNFDFSETPVKDTGSAFNQLFLDLSRDALNSKTAYARLLASVETYMKELIGRIADLTLLNSIIYDPDGQYADPEQRQLALNGALESVKSRHADIEADFDKIGAAAGDADDENDTKELVGGIKVKNAMIENNAGWLAELSNTDANWGVAAGQQQKLIDRLSKFLQDVRALPTIKLPEVSLEDDNAADAEQEEKAEDGADDEAAAEDADADAPAADDAADAEDCDDDEE